MFICNIILLILFVKESHSFTKKYDNYTLYRGIPVNELHLNFFRNLSTVYDVSYWRLPGLLNNPVDLMLSPNDRPSFLRDVDKLGLYVTTVMDNVQEAFNKQTVKSYIRRRTESFDWNSYYRLDDIYNWLRDLTKIHPKFIKIHSIGKTVEHRNIMAVVINLPHSKSKNMSETKTKVIIEGGIHAREWIAISFVTYLINTILHAPFSKDKLLKKIAYEYEWYFVPVLNPDGYEYSHTTDRMWRKNRKNGYYGVDINRNFEYSFGTRGVSFEESNEIYCGPTAFSENESKAMAGFVKAHANNLGYYFAFHSYGQYIIIPYADMKQHLENFELVKLMAAKAGKRISKKFGTQYTIGTAYDTVGYMTSGVSGDWVKKNFGVEVACTFELRDNGRYGFALPPNLILPTCEETMEGMISFLTPRKKGWEDKMRNQDMLAGQEKKLLDIFVLICNILLFIIVRFD